MSAEALALFRGAGVFAVSCCVRAIPCGRVCRLHALRGRNSDESSIRWSRPSTSSRISRTAEKLLARPPAGVGRIRISAAAAVRRDWDHVRDHGDPRGVDKRIARRRRGLLRVRSNGQFLGDRCAQAWEQQFERWRYRYRPCHSTPIPGNRGYASSFERSGSFGCRLRHPLHPVSPGGPGNRADPPARTGGPNSFRYSGLP